MRKAVFGFLITIVLLVMVLWIWAKIVPSALNPSISTSIEATADDEYAEGIGFFLRMLPWAVPVIILIGMLYVGASR